MTKKEKKVEVPKYHGRLTVGIISEIQRKMNAELYEPKKNEFDRKFFDWLCLNSKEYLHALQLMSTENVKEYLYGSDQISLVPLNKESHGYSYRVYVKVYAQKQGHRIYIRNDEKYRERAAIEKIQSDIEIFINRLHLFKTKSLNVVFSEFPELRKYYNPPNSTPTKSKPGFELVRIETLNEIHSLLSSLTKSI